MSVICSRNDVIINGNVCHHRIRTTMIVTVRNGYSKRTVLVLIRHGRRCRCGGRGWAGRWRRSRRRCRCGFRGRGRGRCWRWCRCRCRCLSRPVTRILLRSWVIRRAILRVVIRRLLYLLRKRLFCCRNNRNLTRGLIYGVLFRKKRISNKTRCPNYSY